MKTDLTNIAVVLVEPAEPGNIGSCCRAMKNMGIYDLRLVNPVPYLVPETFKLCYGADDLVLNAQTYPDIKSAVSDAAFTVGTTRRRGKHRKPVHWISDVLPAITAHSQNNRVAILFGREAKGLSNDELRLCDEQIAIPTRDDFPTLNLAQSVLIVCYELFLSRHPVDEIERSLVPHGELELMYDHLNQALKLLQYGKKGTNDLRRRIMNAFRRIFSRSGLEPKELQMIHGICSRIELLLGEESGTDDERHFMA